MFPLCLIERWEGLKSGVLADVFQMDRTLRSTLWSSYRKAQNIPAWFLSIRSISISFTAVETEIERVRHHFVTLFIWSSDHVSFVAIFFLIWSLLLSSGLTFSSRRVSLRLLSERNDPSLQVAARWRDSAAYLPLPDYSVCFFSHCLVTYNGIQRDIYLEMKWAHYWRQIQWQTACWEKDKQQNGSASPNGFTSMTTK